MKNIQILLPIKNTFGIILLILLLECTTDNGILITFNAQINGETLEYGKSYPSPNGDGSYTIIDFKLYVSNIQLLNDENEALNYIEEESYHLLKFQERSQYSFKLENAPSGSYNKIRISIGIDEDANLAINNPGDLDPTNQMAWNWTSGYKFLLLEGLYSPESSEYEVPIVFHIGFSENKKDLEFEISSSKDIQFAIEINELFKNPNDIDFNILPKVLFNEEQASMVAMNYGDSFIILK